MDRTLTPADRALLRVHNLAWEADREPRDTPLGCTLAHQLERAVADAIGALVAQGMPEARAACEATYAEWFALDAH